MRAIVFVRRTPSKLDEPETFAISSITMVGDDGDPVNEAMPILAALELIDREETAVQFELVP